MRRDAGSHKLLLNSLRECQKVRKSVHNSSGHEIHIAGLPTTKAVDKRYNRAHSATNPCAEERQSAHGANSHGELNQHATCPEAPSVTKLYQQWSSS